MKILIVWLLILIGCSYRGEDSQDRILKLQSVWDSRDIRVAIKKDKKIISVVAPVGRGEEVPSRLIKEKLKSDDWKIYEHPRRGIDYIQLDVTEYSEALGVGFAYDKLDKEKKVRMIYWGVDPKKIQQVL